MLNKEITMKYLIALLTLIIATTVNAKAIFEAGNAYQDTHDNLYVGAGYQHNNVSVIGFSTFDTVALVDTITTKEDIRYQNYGIKLGYDVYQLSNTYFGLTITPLVGYQYNSTEYRYSYKANTKETSSDVFAGVAVKVNYDVLYLQTSINTVGDTTLLIGFNF